MATDKRAKLLVIDDAPDNAKMLQAMLTLAGYETTTAGDWGQAISQVAQKPPDLILLDTVMPKSDGYEICSRLKRSEATSLIPVILIAIPGGKNERVKALAAGGDALLEGPVNRAELLAQVESLVRAKRLRDEMIGMESAIMALATAIEARDPYAEGHIERVVSYASSLGEVIGLSQQELELVRNGGILHDVGKIGIRESVLAKRGPLSDEELEHIRLHPIIGERICQPLRSRGILDIVRHHHERYDGRGYPDGLAGEDIPLAARIMAVADAYDALTSDRSYRRRFSDEEAFDVIRTDMGSRFDPELISAFAGVVGWV